MKHKKVKRFDPPRVVQNICCDCGAEFLFDKKLEEWYCPNDPERLNRQVRA